MVAWLAALGVLIKAIPRNQRVYVAIAVVVVGGLLYGQQLRHEWAEDEQRTGLEKLFQDFSKMRCN